MVNEANGKGTQGSLLTEYRESGKGVKDCETSLHFYVIAGPLSPERSDIF
jgi:hypothetical protein